MGQNVYTAGSLQEAQDQASALAKENFKAGLNCAEAVLKACLDMGFAPDFPPEVIALSSGFGGGIGMTKHTCGAVSGAVSAVGAVCGRRNPLGKETLPERVREIQQEVYPTFRSMVEAFIEQYGSITCAELTSAHGDFEGKERKRSCMQMITYAAALAVEYARSGR